MKSLPNQKLLTKHSVPVFVFHRVLARFHKRDRARRAERVYRHYDETLGYGEYSRHCQSVSQRKSSAPASGSLLSDGFAYLNVLPSGACRDVIDTLAVGNVLAPSQESDPNPEVFQVTDRLVLERLLALILIDAVDEQLLSYFQSEYLVHTLTVTATSAQAPRRSVSFAWHCDKGPTRHLKLIVYLNASEEHGGNTEFIDLAHTAAVAERGYLFGLSGARTDNIEHLRQIAGRGITSHCRSMRTGQGVLFQPAKVLHRGIAPHRGVRRVITLCLLPSPVPWAEALAKRTLTNLASEPKWHRQASELRSAIECDASQP